MQRLKDFTEKTEAISITDAAIEVVKEIQQILKDLGYYDLPIDGVVGKETREALAEFKEDRYLAYPLGLGASTAKSLLEGKHKVSEQIPSTSVRLLDSEVLGSQTGRSMSLPDGKVVWANQLIIPGIPLTFGEMTKSCTRVPENMKVVENLEKIAKVFGEIRDKFEKPIGVTSGYRPPAVNVAIGGAQFSQHVNGLALDMYPLRGNMSALLEVVKASSASAIGLGMHRGFIHVDARGGSRLVFGY